MLGPTDSCAQGVKDTQDVFHEKVPGYNFSFSNHFVVESTFDVVGSDERFGQKSDGDIRREPSLALVKTLNDALFESSKISKRQMNVVVASAASLLCLAAFSSLFPGHFTQAITLLCAGLESLCAMNFCSGYLYENVEKAVLTRTLEELEYHMRFEIQ